MSGYERISVVGGGTMGSGISLLLKTKNVNVKQIRFRALESLSTDEVRHISESDLIIECGPETQEGKRKILEFVGGLNSSADIGTCTSSFTVSSLSSLCVNPNRFFGLHFMNPPIAIPFVEVIAGASTSPECIERSRSWLEHIGSVPVVVPDTPGFIVNAILFGMLNTAARVFESSGLEAIELDRLMVGVAGFKMGPLATLDYVGLDVAKVIIDNLHSLEPSSNSATAVIINDFVNKGRLGRKTGKGFFDY